MIETGGLNPNEDGKHLWSNILSEVRANSSLKLPSRKAILVLGNAGTGKTTLVARLQGAEDPKMSSGLEYQYIDVKDEDRDDHTKLSVWILDGDPYHANLLKFAITETNVADCMAVIVVSMSEPWSIVESLNQWVDLLEKHIARLKLPVEDMVEYRESLVRHFQDYVEPDNIQVQPVSAHHAPGRRQTNPLHPPAPQPSEGSPDRVILPLPEGAFAHNLGIPIVVVVTKTDCISMLEKEYDYRDEHFDYIQHQIRKFCLEHGAGLFYTSVKEDKNCDLLNRYIQHRIYGFPFLHTAYVVEKDSIFVPTGWDNNKKMAILMENMGTLKIKDAYQDVICRPAVRKAIQREPEVVATDEQQFLASLLTTAGSGSPGDTSRTRQDSPHRASATSGSPRTPGSAAMRGKTLLICQNNNNASTTEDNLESIVSELPSPPHLHISQTSQHRHKRISSEPIEIQLVKSKSSPPIAARLPSSPNHIQSCTESTTKLNVAGDDDYKRQYACFQNMLKGRSPNTISSKKVGANIAAGGPGSDGVLANFFNSLLNKKSGSPGGPSDFSASSSPQTSNGVDKDKATLSKNAQAELDKLQDSSAPPPAISLDGADSSSSST